MATSRFVEITDKEISKIKINSVPKNTKDVCKNTKTIIRRRRVSNFIWKIDRTQ